MTHPLLTDLAQILPANALICDAERLAPRLLDERKRFQGAALALALPDSPEQAAQIMAACRQYGVAMVPQAGNTGLVGGATPLPLSSQQPSLLIGCDRLNRIRQLDAASFTVTVEAGVVLDDLRQAVDQSGRLFPLWLGSSGSARLGGLISTNAGGLQVLRYGNCRELVLGLEAVLADGRIYRGLHGLRKRNAGYDLKQLLIGGEGTLGLITAASLRLFPQERGRATAMVALPSAQAALHLFAAARSEVGEVLSAFELISAMPMQLMARHHPEVSQPFAHIPPFSVLLELSGGESDAVLQTRLAELLHSAQLEDAVLAQDQSQADKLWALRERIPSAQKREGPSIKQDLALPIAAIPDFIEEAAEQLQQALPQAQPVVFGHMGDGNLHYNLALPATADFAASEQIANALLFALVRQYDGDISAEHGIGRLRIAAADQWHDPVERAMMRQIKQLFDPSGLFNPGVLV